MQRDFIPTRRSLLSRLRNLDDGASWQDFHDTYARLICSVARHAGLNESEAEEVLQETLIFVAKKMPGFKYDPSQGSFKNWLLRATKWRVVDQLRKRTQVSAPFPHASVSPTGTSFMDSIADPQGIELDDIWDAEWEKNLLEAATQRIRRQVKAKHYQAFELYVLRKWPVRKVASALSLSVSQVYLAKHRVSSLLKRELALLEKRLM
jgi:RNA polymerase sigma factor (sigma-70 family)